MPQFEIETYEIQSTAGSDRHRRYLKLVSPDLAHGIRNRAHIYFISSRPGFDSGNAIGVAGNVGGLNFNGITFSVWFGGGTFDEVYEILRSEKPVSFRYSLRDIQSAPEATAKWVSSAGLVTGPELPGEGPADADAALGQVRRMLLSEGDGAADGLALPELDAAPAG